MSLGVWYKGGTHWNSAMFALSKSSWPTGCPVQCQCQYLHFRHCRWVVCCLVNIGNIGQLGEGGLHNPPPGQSVVATSPAQHTPHCRSIAVHWSCTIINWFAHCQWVVSWSRSFLCTRHFWFTFYGRFTGFNLTQVHNDMMQTIKHTVETLPSNNKQKVEASTPCPQGWPKGSNRTALQGRAGIA